VLYFDASALVKRYVSERGSKRVRDLLADGEIVISRLSEIEVVSGLARLARAGAISASARDRSVAAFTSDIAAWYTVEISAAVALVARRLLQRRVLRAGDSIQLACALVLKEGLGAALGEELDVFVCSDERLAQAARAEGFRVTVP
jgi:predicted nucleic acid-binding protein